MEVEEIIKSFSEGKDGSRKLMIRELFQTLKEGNSGNTDKEGYDLWVRTWVFPKLIKLIPEVAKEIKNE